MRATNCTVVATRGSGQLLARATKKKETAPLSFYTRLDRRSTLYMGVQGQVAPRHNRPQADSTVLCPRATGGYKTSITTPTKTIARRASTTSHEQPRAATSSHKQPQAAMSSHEQPPSSESTRLTVFTLQPATNGVTHCFKDAS
jgi:hypothetical protein